MLTLPASVRIYVAAEAVDLRRGFDGLAAATRSLIREDPLNGHLFVFLNRRRNRIKLLVWDGLSAAVQAARARDVPPAHGTDRLSSPRGSGCRRAGADAGGDGPARSPAARALAPSSSQMRGIGRLDFLTDRSGQPMAAAARPLS